MEIQINKLSRLVGSSIQIKRSDGRIHSALVTSIDEERKVAAVQWVEEGDTKAKEIDMAAVEELNPDINFPKEAEGPSQPQMVEKEEPKLTQIQRNPSAGKVMNGKSSIVRPTPAANMSFCANNLHLPSNNHKRAQSCLPSNFNHKRATSHNLRSHVVHEVDRLRVNREERRQKQAEEREAREALVRKDPTNPNRELLLMIMQYRSGIEINPLMDNDPIQDQPITVCVRKRPLNKLELDRKDVDVITIPSKNQLIIHEPKCKVDLTKYLDNQLFRFDYSFDETSSNEIVYRYTAQPLVKTIFEGGQATCFAYGQTGSGKTHTMGGTFNKGKQQDCNKGIYALVAADVFRLAKSPKYKHLNLLISASYFEIYSGNVFDLLNKKAKLKVLEDGKQQVQVVGLTEKGVYSTDDVLKLIQKGNAERTSGTTFANENSSRSHAVFQIFLRSNACMSSSYGKFSLIDLAGNERGSDTASANREIRVEGAEINKALLALKECIRALGRPGAHLPFRVSKLTLVLRDFFLGSNSRICMIAMISPSSNSCEYTLNTLRYADRVKELRGGNVKTTSQPEEAESQDDLSTTLIALPEADLAPKVQAILELQTDLTKTLQVAYHRSVKLKEYTDKVDFKEHCKKFNDFLNNLTTRIEQTKQFLEEYKSKKRQQSQKE